MAKAGFTPQAKRNVYRMLNRVKVLDAGSPEMQGALFKVGTLVRNKAIANISKQGIVDTGILRASMQFRIERADGVARVIVGPFGVVYARLNEMGGAFTEEQRRAMFASFHEQGKRARPGKGIIAGNRWRARPYLIPALKTSQKEIRKILLGSARRVS